jgi:hypothetical protein
MKTTFLTLWHRYFVFDTAWHRVRSVVFLILIALCVYWAYGRSAVYFYTPPNMITLSGKTQTQCVGRYLIDVPVEMGNIGVSSAYFYYGIDKDFKSVEVKVQSNTSQAAFTQVTNNRINELKTTQNRELKIPLLLAQETWKTPHGMALMLRYLEDEFDATSSVRSEVHMLIGNRYTVMQSTSYEDSNDHDRLDEDRIAYKHIDPKPMEKRLEVIAQTIQGYSDASQAPEGFCLNGVVMNNRTMGYDVENTLFNAEVPGTALQNLQFSVHMQGQFQGGGETIIEIAERVGTQLRLMVAAEGGQLFDLRKGKRSINAMPGLEYAYALRAYGGTTFLMQAQNHLPKAEQSLQRPHFTLELTSGLSGDKPSPLTQEQALTIWDTMVDSMRLAPINGGKRVNPQTGALVRNVEVGEACPQDGIWEAFMPSNHRAAKLLASSHDRFRKMKAGEPMPEVFAAYTYTNRDDAVVDNAAVTWTLVRFV